MSATARRALPSNQTPDGSPPGARRRAESGDRGVGAGPGGVPVDLRRRLPVRHHRRVLPADPERVHRDRARGAWRSRAASRTSGWSCSSPLSARSRATRSRTRSAPRSRCASSRSCSSARGQAAIDWAERALAKRGRRVHHRRALHPGRPGGREHDRRCRGVPAPTVRRAHRHRRSDVVGVRRADRHRRRRLARRQHVRRRRRRASSAASRSASSSTGSCASSRTPPTTRRSDAPVSARRRRSDVAESSRSSPCPAQHRASGHGTLTIGPRGLTIRYRPVTPPMTAVTLEECRRDVGTPILVDTRGGALRHGRRRASGRGCDGRAGEVGGGRRAARAVLLLAAVQRRSERQRSTDATPTAVVAAVADCMSPAVLSDLGLVPAAADGTTRPRTSSPEPGEVPDGLRSGQRRGLHPGRHAAGRVRDLARADRQPSRG